MRIEPGTEKTIKSQGDVGSLDLSLPVQTRDGREVIVHKIRERARQIIAFIKDEINPDKWVLRIFHDDGSFFDPCIEFKCGDDLVNCPPKKVKKEGWVNIYKRSPYEDQFGKKRTARVSDAYETAAAAKEGARLAVIKGVPNYVKTVKIEWEEEQ